MITCNVYERVKSGIGRTRVKGLVQSILEGLGQRQAEVSIHCIGLRAMRNLNRIHRGFDRPTDVLSFATEDAVRGMKTGDRGDIFLCVPYIARQAKHFAVPYREEWVRMLIHGLLHILGYDHARQKDAEKMFDLQERLLTRSL